MIVNRCQCIDQHQLQVFTVRAHQKARLVMLLEAIHMELSTAYAVVMNVHYILIMLVKVSFQYLIPSKRYNKPCNLDNQP